MIRQGHNCEELDMPLIDRRAFDQLKSEIDKIPAQRTRRAARNLQKLKAAIDALGQKLEGRYEAV